jgi:hypothetical protein
MVSTCYTDGIFNDTMIIPKITLLIMTLLIMNLFIKVLLIMILLIKTIKSVINNVIISHIIHIKC